MSVHTITSRPPYSHPQQPLLPFFPRPSLPDTDLLFMELADQRAAMDDDLDRLIELFPLVHDDEIRDRILVAVEQGMSMIRVADAYLATWAGLNAEIR